LFSRFISLYNCFGYNFFIFFKELCFPLKPWHTVRIYLYYGNYALFEGVKKMDYTITKNTDGSLTISTMIDGYRFHRLYIGYTEKEAEALFTAELNKR